MMKPYRRTDILKAAAAVFAQKGYGDAKIEEIARKAGIGKGTIYEYFESKKQLFEAMVQYSFEVYVEQLKDILGQEMTIRDRLICFSRFQAEFTLGHLDMIQSVQTHVLSQELKNWLLTQKESIKTVLKSFIEEGIDSGELRSDLDKEIASHCIFATINHYIPSKIFIDKKQPHEIDHEAVVDTVLRGLSVPKQMNQS